MPLPDPPAPSSHLTFAVGDIHGCLTKLRRLRKACDDYAAGRPARYIFLGDYIDRGPQSRGVIEHLMEWQQAAPDDVLCLKGNHEQIAIDAHNSADKVAMWLKNGGVETQTSYSATGGRIPDEHLAWMKSLPLAYDDGVRFFVHAGVDLDVPLNQQSPETVMWIRDAFYRLSDTIDCGRFIVHGHTPQTGGEPDLRKHRVNLDTAAVLGGPLTAGVFDDTQAAPLGFIPDSPSLASTAAGWIRGATS